MGLVREEVSKGVLDAELEKGKFQDITYKGETDLLVINRDTRSKAGKMGMEDLTLKTMLYMLPLILLGMVLANFSFDILGMIFMVMGLVVTIPFITVVFNEKEPYTNAKSIKSEGKGRVINVKEKELNNIVKLKSGEIRRVYQLINDKDILNKIDIKREQITDYYLPIGVNIGIDRIVVDDKNEDKTVEGRAIYNIGQSIPKIEEGDKDSIIQSLTKVYKHKTDVENSKEYDEVYGKLLEDNKDLYTQIPKIGGSQDYLKEEISNINMKVNKELNTNKELVERI